MKNLILNHFKSVDPLIHRQLMSMDFKLLVPQTDLSVYFPKLCREIIGQQLAGKAADAICSRFELFIGKKITPDRVLQFSESDYRNTGLSWAKAKYVLDLAQKVRTNEVQLNKLHQMTDAEVINELIKVKGIGPWTAEMFLIFTLGREDVFSFGDLGLRKGFQQLYDLTEVQAAQKIKKITSSWSPYRSYASLALWHTKDSKG